MTGGKYFFYNVKPKILLVHSRVTGFNYVHQAINLLLMVYQVTLK